MYNFFQKTVQHNLALQPSHRSLPPSPPPFVIKLDMLNQVTSSDLIFKESMSADLKIRQICFVIQIELPGADNSVNLVATFGLDIRVQSQVHQNPFQGTTDCLPSSFDQKKVTIQHMTVHLTLLI